MPNRPVKWLHGKVTRSQLTYLVVCACLAISNGVTGYIAVTTSNLANDTAQDVAAQQSATEALVTSNASLVHDNKVLAQETHAELSETRAALCNFTEDLARRVESTKDFLQHPEKYPAFNDPKTLLSIKTQYDGQVRTLNSLQGLNCPK